MWLLRDDDVLATLEERRTGWQSAISGAVIITRPAIVHTFVRSAPVDLDTAWCQPAELSDGRPGYEVRRISCLGPHRFTLPRFSAGALVVAPAGSFERWRLQVGDRLEVRGS